MRRAFVWLLPFALALGLAFPASVLADAPTASAVTPSTLEDTLVTVDLAGDDADGDPLTFAIATTPSAGNLTSTIYNVNCTGDTQNPPSHCTAEVDYTPNANYAGSDSFTYVVNDGVTDSSAATASITVTGVNDPPSFTDGGNKTVLEDSGAASYVGWATSISRGGGADESSQTLTFVPGLVSNPGLFSSAPAVSAGGTLTFTPAANANGSSTVAFTLQDNGGTANSGDDTSSIHTITITVTAVNDAPSFTAGSDQSVNEDSGPASFSTWATSPSVGPSNESAQTYSYVISSNSNPSLFGTAPAVATNGTLSFTPAANRFGTSTIGVRIQDNGGSTNGGIDISGEQTFVITVTNVDDPPNAVNDLHVPIAENAGATAINVLANDTYLPDPVETLSITAVTQGAHGAVVITGGGTGLTYQPATGFVGSDQFTYTIQDSGGSTTDQGTVQVDVAGDTAAPVMGAVVQYFPTGSTVGTGTAIPVKVRWSATDAGVGVAKYQLQQSVDGGAYTSLTLATDLTTFVIRADVVGHTYRYRVRAIDGIGNTSAYAYSPAFKAARYEDNSTVVHYTGTWTPISSTSYSGGTMHWSASAGAIVTLTATGRDFAIVGPKSSTRGTFQVYIDGVLNATVSETGAASFRKILWYHHYAASATHQIKIVVVGPNRIDLDAFLVLR